MESVQFQPVRSARLPPKPNAVTPKVQFGHCHEEAKQRAGWKIHCCLSLWAFSPETQYSIAQQPISVRGINGAM